MRHGGHWSDASTEIKILDAPSHARFSMIRINGCIYVHDIN